MIDKENKPIHILYTIKVNGKYIKTIEANSNYTFGACSPTMGTCHSNCEFTVVLDDEPTLIEKLTVANYLKVLFSEFTWQEKPLGIITVEPVVKRGDE